MTTLIILIIVLFPVGILLRKMFPNLCALCFAVFAAWLTGLLSPAVKNFMDPSLFDNTALGILMGGSAVGSMYFLFSKLSEEKQLLKLPFLVTLFALVYVALTFSFSWFLAAVIAALWLAFFALYAGRNAPRLKEAARRVIECCKNW